MRGSENSCNPMGRLIMIAALLAALTPLSGPPAAAQDRRFDVTECREQAQAFARLDVDCTLVITARQGDLDRAPAFLRALIADLECQIPLKFDKAEVYGGWITDNRVNPPPIRVDCTVLEGAGLGRISGIFDADCVRLDGQWACYPGLSDVTGLGPLGSVVEEFVNDEGLLGRFLAKQLDRFD